MSIFCIWLEDQELTANSFKLILEAEGIGYTLQSSQNGFMGYLNDPEAKFRTEKLKPVALVDLKIYESTLNRENDDDEDIDLGFKVVESMNSNPDIAIPISHICILTEREIDSEVISRAESLGIMEAQIFRKYVDEELVRFKTLIRELKGGKD